MLKALSPGNHNRAGTLDLIAWFEQTGYSVTLVLSAHGAQSLTRNLEAAVREASQLAVHSRDRLSLCKSWFAGRTVDPQVKDQWQPVPLSRQYQPHSTREQTSNLLSRVVTKVTNTYARAKI